jgi:hypothetical protein
MERIFFLPKEAPDTVSQFVPIFQLAFPDDEEVPSEFSKPFLVSFVTLFVALQLRLPEFQLRLGQPA